MILSVIILNRFNFHDARLDHVTVKMKRKEVAASQIYKVISKDVLPSGSIALRSSATLKVTLTASSVWTKHAILIASSCNLMFRVPRMTLRRTAAKIYPISSLLVLTDGCGSSLILNYAFLITDGGPERDSCG